METTEKPLNPVGFANNPQLPGFGARLKRLRRSCNIKQAHIAHVVGVDQSTVSGVAESSSRMGQANNITAR